VGIDDASSVSVIMATYNDVGRIKDALDSIVGQTWPPGQIVIADDGSTDGTGDFVAEFAAEQTGSVDITYLRFESKPGVVVARNQAAGAARGEWIANCDSDDVWEPRKLQSQLEFIDRWTGSKPVTLLGTHGWNMNDRKRIVSPAVMGPTTAAEFETLRATGGIPYVIHSSALFSKQHFQAVGGYPSDYGYLDDIALYCRLADRGVVLNLTEQLTYYRKRAGSIQIARFWDQQTNLERLAENERRKVRGLPALTAPEFSAQVAARPVSARLNRRRRLYGMLYYRNGAADVVNGRWLRGGTALTLGTMLDAGRVRSGVMGAMRSRLGVRRP
jgi:glycosyltransferase involved in cell wall biosynthesis